MVILNPQFIIIHHSVTDGSYQTGLNIIKRQEQNFGKNSVTNSYHFMLTIEGHIISWKPENLMIGHCGVDGYSYSNEPCNANSLGICFLGNFEKENVPEIQFQAGLMLIKGLVKKYNIKDIVGHRDIINTECPGANLYKRIPEIKKEVFKMPLEKWEEEVIKNAFNKGWIKDSDIHLSKAKEPFSRAEVLAVLMNYNNSNDKVMIKKIVKEILLEILKEIGE